MVQPAPGPWKLEDNEKRSYKVVAKDGSVVCYIHYPKSMQDAANIRVVENAWTLVERFKGLCTVLDAYIRQNGQDPKKDPTSIANQELLDDLAVKNPPKKPPGAGG